MAGEKLILVGAISGAFGVRGELRLKSFCAEPSDIATYGPLLSEDGARRFVIKALRPVPDGLAAQIEGIASREAAEALRGTALYVPRDHMPNLAEDEFYHADLIGLRVQDGSGAPLGTLKAIHNHGAGDILEIARPAGPALLLPFTRALVPRIDLAAGVIIADPPPEAP